MSIISLLIIIGVLVVIYKYLGKNDKRLPPGPFSLPILGNLLQVGTRSHLTFMKWAKKYGPIFKLQLGLETVVVIDDYKLMKDVFSDPVFSGRPQNELFVGLSKGPNGVINSEGENWEMQRRFTLRHLRDFGFGKNHMESLIMDEVKEIIDWFKREEGQPVSVNRKFSLAVLNSLWAIMNGKRFSQDDPQLTNMLDTANETFNAIQKKGGFLLFAPWIRHIIPELSGWTSVENVVNNMWSFFEKTVQEAKDTYSEGHVRHFVDNYINEIEKTDDPNSSFYKEKGYTNLAATVGDLFQAGSETTSNTLGWGILYLTAHPAVQEKMHQEIDKVVGKSRPPTLADRPQMPYTEAIIMEILRYSSLVPIGVFHRSFADKEISGYHIPKGTWIIPNLHSVHNNPEIWGDPENFRPERFIGEDGKAKKHEALVPFQMGKRQCLGEPLARDTIFLFATSIFQRFQVLPDPSNPKFDFEPQIGFLQIPKKFHVVMKDRLD